MKPVLQITAHESSKLKIISTEHFETKRVILMFHIDLFNQLYKMPFETAGFFENFHE